MAATTAPIRTTGSIHPAPAAVTASSRGVAELASREGPSVVKTANATTAYTTSAIPRAIGMARGMVRAGSRTSSPSVAMRAYPAKAKNNRPAACSTPRHDVPVRSRAAISTLPEPAAVATTAASTDNTIATMTRVSHADFCTPT
ncbi:Uncharacterised protein [Mycobacteroides abscessus subsp. abscessus]|nr:Uncharacterised protein [Mycobacteroides abscessus subsp. abscessus]